METLQKELDALCHMIRAAVVTLIEIEDISMAEYATRLGIPLETMESIHLFQFEKVSTNVVRLLAGVTIARKYKKLTRLAVVEKQQEWEQLIYNCFFSRR